MYSFSDVGVATSLGQGWETKKGKCWGTASFLLRTVLAHTDFWHSIYHVLRKKIVFQTVFILRSPSLGLPSMIE